MSIFDRIVEYSNISKPSERVPKEDGGMLVQPSNDGSRPGYRSDKAIKAAQQAGNIARKEARLAKIGELFINKDYKKLKVKTRKARMGKGSIDAGGVLNAQDKTMLNNIIYNGTVKEQNALAKSLGINRQYMIEVYNEAEKLKDEGKALQQSKAQLAKVQTQKELFDEILNNKNATVESMAKKFKMTKKEITKEASKLLKNVYAQNVAIGKGPEFDIDSRGNRTLKSWLPDNFETTDSFLDNFANIKGLKNVQTENMSILIRNAYGNDPKKFTAAMKGLSEYNKLVNSLPEGIKLDLDHPLSKAFLKGSGVSPEKLLYVTPISREYNRGFKQSLSMAYDKALLNPNKDKKLIKTIENFADTIGVNIGKGSTKKLDFGTTPITKKTQAGLAEELAQNLREQNMARENLAEFRKTKEGQEIINQIFPSGRAQLNIPKVNKTLFKKLMVFCPKSVGGEAGVCSIDEAMQGLISESKQLQSGNMNPAQAKRTAEKIRAVTRVGTGSTLMNLLGPYGVAGEVVFDGTIMANNMLEGGDTYKEALSKSLIKYAMPTADRKKLEEETDRSKMILGSDTRGLAADYVSAQQKYDDLIKKYENLQKIKKDETFDPDTLVPTYSPRDEIKAEKEFQRAQVRAEPLYKKNIFDILKFGSPEQEAFAAKEEVFDAEKMQRRMDYDRKILGPLKDLFGTGFYSPEQLKRLQKKADRDTEIIGLIPDELKTKQVADFGGVANLAGGGIAKMAGDRSGAMLTSMNPDSGGLSGLYKRAMKMKE